MSNQHSLLALLARYFPEINSQDWQITPLAGLSGGSYRLRATIKMHTIDVIARAQGTVQSSLMVNRRKEARVLHQLRGFAQAPRQLARNRDWLLLSWCDGQHPSAEQFLTPQFQSALAETIAKLHTQPLLSYRLQLRHEITHYGYLIDRKRQQPRWQRLHHYFLSAAMPKTLKLAPAHMDIHRGNILYANDKSITLLDWEYAANTDIGLSLETYFQANQLDAKQRQFFLHQYGAQHRAYTDVANLARHCVRWEPWVKYMMLMWYEVQWNQSQNPNFLVGSQPLRQYFHLTN